MTNDIAMEVHYLHTVLSELVSQRKEEFEWQKSHHGAATKSDLNELGAKILQAIGASAEEQKGLADLLIAAERNTLRLEAMAGALKALDAAQ